MRFVLLLHRYLGIGLGLIMLMWCLSGIVMMYVSYPSLDEGLRLKALEPIAWSGCCKFPAASLDALDAGRSHVEMLAGHPILLLGGSSPRPINLQTGSMLGAISVAQAAAVAKRFGAGTLSLPALIDHDQWTVAGDLNSQRPLYRFALGDAARSELYVSSITGRAVQITTARQRFWNWLGSVPHWLYFTELRRNTALWSRTVVCASLLGCFLTGVGVYLGVRQLMARPAGRWSPYLGFNLWHHLAGLLFGIFTLTWVFSGLLSMNPWGWLEGSDAADETTRLHGTLPPAFMPLGSGLQLLAEAQPTDAVSIETAPLGGRIYFIASTASGERRRLDAAGAPAPLGADDLTFIAKTLDPSAVPQLMRQDDAFYFAHHGAPVMLPVYRLVHASTGTRYYLDAVSGLIVTKIDRNVQAYRWLHMGLHRLDFFTALRRRPQWDMLMLLLMAGVTAVCGTGTYLGIRHVARAIRSS